MDFLVGYHFAHMAGWTQSSPLADAGRWLESRGYTTTNYFVSNCVAVVLLVLVGVVGGVVFEYVTRGKDVLAAPPVVASAPVAAPTPEPEEENPYTGECTQSLDWYMDELNTEKQELMNELQKDENNPKLQERLERLDKEYAFAWAAWKIAEKKERDEFDWEAEREQFDFGDSQADW